MIFEAPEKCCGQPPKFQSTLSRSVAVVGVPTPGPDPLYIATLEWQCVVDSSHRGGRWAMGGDPPTDATPVDAGAA